MSGPKSRVAIAYKDKTYTVKELSILVGCSTDCIRGRIQYGWSIERILNTPAKLRGVRPAKRDSSTKVFFDPLFIAKIL